MLREVVIHDAVQDPDRGSPAVECSVELDGNQEAGQPRSGTCIRTADRSPTRASCCLHICAGAQMVHNSAWCRSSPPAATRRGEVIALNTVTELTEWTEHPQHGERQTASPDTPNVPEEDPCPPGDDATSHDQSDRRFAGHLRAGWLRKLRRHDGEGVTVEDRKNQIEERLELLVPRLAGAARVLVVLLLLISVLATIAAALVDLNNIIPRASIIVATLTVVPTILEVFERSRKKSSSRKYRAWTERLTERIVRLVRRHKLAALFALYGRQEVATRLLPTEEAIQFSVHAQTRRRDQMRLWTCVSILAALAALTAYSLSVLHKDYRYHIGQEFALDSIYKLTVLGTPTCKATGEYEYQGPTCSVEIRIRNVSRDAHSVGSGSFSKIKSYGPRYVHEIDHDIWYATTAAGGGNYYEYETATFSKFTLQPQEFTTANFIFNVPYGVTVDELQFATEGSSGIIHIDFHSP